MPTDIKTIQGSYFTCLWQNIMTKSILWKSLFWLTVQKNKSPSWWGNMALSSRHGNRNRKLKGYILKSKHEVDSELELQWSYILISPPQWHTFSNMATSLKSFQRVPHNGTKYPNIYYKGSLLIQTTTVQPCKTLQGPQKLVCFFKVQYLLTKWKQAFLCQN